MAWLDDNNKYYTIENVLQKKGLGTEIKPAHVEPPLIPLIKETSTGKSDGDNVKKTA